MKLNTTYQHIHMPSTTCIVLEHTAKGCKTRVTETPAKGSIMAWGKTKPFTTIQYYNTIDFDSAKGFWKEVQKTITANQIAQLRAEVLNIRKATSAGTGSFEVMAKLHNSNIYTCRYNEIGYILCDTMAVKEGKTIITEQNLQYYPAKIRFYFSKIAIILFFALLGALPATYAQNAVKDASGNYTAVKHSQTDTGKATVTGKTFTDAKGKVFPVYVSERGKLYCIKTSKAGNVYKMYLKVD